MSDVVTTNIIGCNSCGTIKRHGPGTIISWILCKNCYHTAFFSYPSFTPYVRNRYVKPPTININGPIGRELFWDSTDNYHLLNPTKFNNRDFSYCSINGCTVFRRNPSYASFSTDSDTS